LTGRLEGVFVLLSILIVVVIIPRSVDVSEYFGQHLSVDLLSEL